MFAVGSKVVHPLHGIGTVETFEHGVILGQTCDFACITFQEGGLHVKVNINSKSFNVRPLVEKSEIDKILAHMETETETLPPRSSDRYNFNMRKVMSCDIYQLAEVIRDLTALSKSHKITPKEQQMLKQARKNMALEFSYITDQDEETFESEIDEICRGEKKIRGEGCAGELR